MAKSLKRGEEVVVITGSEKGKRGKILQLIKSKDRVLVEGVGMRKKYLPKTQENPEGGEVQKETSVHRSNIMPAEKYDSRRSKRS